MRDDGGWRPWPESECQHCGGSLEIQTEAPERQANEGDPVRCCDCGCPGEIVVDEDFNDDGADESENVHGVARAVQHDDAECECAWCLKHQIGLDGRCSGCTSDAEEGSSAP